MKVEYHSFKPSPVSLKLGEILAKIEYRGVWCRIGDMYHGENPAAIQIIEFFRMVDNACNPGSTIGVCISLQISELLLSMTPDQEIVRLVHDKMIEWEIHELNEFFTYNGIKIYDPHPPKDHS